jgi:hypothetical protein
MGKQQLWQDAAVQEQQQDGQDGSNRGAAVDLVPQKQVQQLCSIFKQRTSLKHAYCITISTPLYAAAALRVACKT